MMFVKKLATLEWERLQTKIVTEKEFLKDQ